MWIFLLRRAINKSAMDMSISFEAALKALWIVTQVYEELSFNYGPKIVVANHGKIGKIENMFYIEMLSSKLCADHNVPLQIRLGNSSPDCIFGKFDEVSNEFEATDSIRTSARYIADSIYKMFAEKASINNVPHMIFYSYLKDKIIEAQVSVQMQKEILYRIYELLFGMLPLSRNVFSLLDSILLGSTKLCINDDNYLERIRVNQMLARRCISDFTWDHNTMNCSSFVNLLQKLNNNLALFSDVHMEFLIMGMIKRNVVVMAKVQEKVDESKIHFDYFDNETLNELVKSVKKVKLPDPKFSDLLHYSFDSFLDIRGVRSSSNDFVRPNDSVLRINAVSYAKPRCPTCINLVAQRHYPNNQSHQPNRKQSFKKTFKVDTVNSNLNGNDKVIENLVKMVIDSPELWALKYQPNQEQPVVNTFSVNIVDQNLNEKSKFEKAFLQSQAAVNPDPIDWSSNSPIQTFVAQPIPLSPVQSSDQAVSDDKPMETWSVKACDRNKEASYEFSFVAQDPRYVVNHNLNIDSGAAESSIDQPEVDEFSINGCVEMQCKPVQDVNLSYNTLYNFITVKNDDSHSRNANVSDLRQCPTVKQVNDRIFIPFGEYQFSSILVEIPCRGA